MRVVVDTNVWVCALIVPDSVPGRVLEAFREHRFDVVASWELVQEIADVLRRPRIRDRYSIANSDIEDLLVLLAPALPTIDVQVAVRDPNDAPVIATAIGGEADAIVTGDADLLDHPRLRAWLLQRGVEVLRAAELLRRLEGD